MIQFEENVLFLFFFDFQNSISNKRSKMKFFLLKFKYVVCGKRDPSVNSLRNAVHADLLVVNTEGHYVQAMKQVSEGIYLVLKPKEISPEVQKKRVLVIPQKDQCPPNFVNNRIYESHHYIDPLHTSIVTILYVFLIFLLVIE